VLAEPVPAAAAAGLAAANARLRAQLEGLARRSMPVRIAAFTTQDAAGDLASLAADEHAEAILAPLFAPGALALLDAASWHLALVAGRDAAWRGDVVAVPFGGTSHDWAALELATWLGRGGRARVLLVGLQDAGRRGRDASRLLAVASLAAQRVAGIHVDTTLAGDHGGALRKLVADATVLVGVSERWRQEGIGVERRGLAARRHGATLIVRGALTSGALSVRESLTRHPWSQPAPV
jgi:hypothetical protein